MQKIKFNNTIFTLFPGGINYFDKELLPITFLPGDKTLTEIDAIVSDTSNTRKIELLSEDGEVLEIFSDFICVQELKKMKDKYFCVEESVGNNGETQSVEMCSDVVTVTLKKEDLREKIKKQEKEITDLQLALVEVYEGMTV